MELCVRLILCGKCTDTTAANIHNSVTNCHSTVNRPRGQRRREPLAIPKETRRDYSDLRPRDWALSTGSRVIITGPHAGVRLLLITAAVIAAVRAAWE